MASPRVKFTHVRPEPLQKTGSLTISKATKMEVVMLNRDDRNAIDGLFRRLEEAERRGGPRDAEAEALIEEKIAGQPAAPYYLAQTVVIQQEALKEAERRLEELERGGRSIEQRRGPWDHTPQYQSDDRPPQRAGYGSGGFLAGAAQTALGVAGGVMLGSMIGSLFSVGGAQAAESPAQDSTGSDNSNDDNGDSGDGDSGGGDGFDVGGDF